MGEGEFVAMVPFKRAMVVSYRLSIENLYFTIQMVAMMMMMMMMMMMIIIITRKLCYSKDDRAMRAI